MKAGALAALLALGLCAQPCDLERSLKEAGLVAVQAVDPSLQVDLKYAGTDNFVHTDVYGCLYTCYLRPEAAAMLAEAHRHLRRLRPDLRFRVFDGARPRRVQRIFWDALKLPEDRKADYVASPVTGSIHNFGLAVDLTVATADGKPLDMGTPFDHFGEAAGIADEAGLMRRGLLTPAQAANRRLLRDAMTAAGFLPMASEWWHFDAMTREAAAKRYPIIE